MEKAIRPITLENGSVTLLDQTRLPLETGFININSAAELV